MSENLDMAQSKKKFPTVIEYFMYMYMSVWVAQLEEAWTVNHVVGRSSPS